MQAIFNIKAQVTFYFEYIPLRKYGVPKATLSLVLTLKFMPLFLWTRQEQEICFLE